VSYEIEIEICIALHYIFLQLIDGYLLLATPKTDDDNYDPDDYPPVDQNAKSDWFMKGKFSHFDFDAKIRDVVETVVQFLNNTDNEENEETATGKVKRKGHQKKPAKGGRKAAKASGSIARKGKARACTPETEITISTKDHQASSKVILATLRSLQCPAADVESGPSNTTQGDGDDIEESGEDEATKAETHNSAKRKWPLTRSSVQHQGELTTSNPSNPSNSLFPMTDDSTLMKDISTEARPSDMSIDKLSPDTSQQEESITREDKARAHTPETVEAHQASSRAIPTTLRGLQSPAADVESGPTDTTQQEVDSVEEFGEDEDTTAGTYNSGKRKMLLAGGSVPRRAKLTHSDPSNLFTVADNSMKDASTEARSSGMDVDESPLNSSQQMKPEDGGFLHHSFLKTFLSVVSQD
jgi:hypothetical protein